MQGLDGSFKAMAATLPSGTELLDEIPEADPTLLFEVCVCVCECVCVCVCGTPHHLGPTSGCACAVCSRKGGGLFECSVQG
jgi:hypothetical protein